MKHLRKVIAVLVVLGVIASNVTVFAAVVVKTPTEILSALTGKSVTEIYNARVAGKSYYTIAKEAAKLTDFQSQTLAQRKALLDQSVKDKTLTKAQADEIYNLMKTNQATCDGTGKNRGMGRGLGMGHGMGMGMGYGGIINR